MQKVCLLQTCLSFSVRDSPSVFCLYWFTIALMNWTENYSWPQIVFGTRCLTVSIGAPQIGDFLASLHSHQHWPLLKTSEMSSILHWCFLDPHGPNIYGHFHFFWLASWSVADVSHSGAASYSPGIMLLIFPRAWCRLHVSHTELQVWCKCELNM